MKKVVALVGVLAAAFLIFWFVQKNDVAVEDKSTPDFSQTEQVAPNEDFFTNRDLNELDQVNYPRHKELMDDLTGEGKLVRKTTQKEFVGARANEDGLSWTGYFEK